MTEDEKRKIEEEERFRAEVRKKVDKESAKNTRIGCATQIFYAGVAASLAFFVWARWFSS